MPEDLPTPKKGIKQIERKQKELEKNKNRPCCNRNGFHIHPEMYP